MPNLPLTRNFSLVNGGLLYSLLVRLRLVTPGASVALPVVAVFLLLSWLPLLFLTIAEEHFVGAVVRVPFVLDFAVHLRFLAALPILLLSERIIGQRIAEAVWHFEEFGLVAERDRPKMEAAVEEAKRRRDSLAPEIFIVFLIAVAGFLGWREILLVSTWLQPSPGSATLAGLWYAAISVPLFQFVLLRWFWRFVIWALLLWRIARISLQLSPAHPDTAGGLGYLGLVQEKFGLLILAFSILTSANTGERILYDGISLTTLQPTLLTFVALMIGVFVAPLFVFTPTLISVKRRGLLQYGGLAIRYVRLFENRWILEKRENELLGTGDIQSLADLGTSYDYVRKMRPFVFNGGNLAALGAAAVIPLLPLALTLLPIKEIIRLLWKLLF
jgi:hypothetical protein